MYRANTRRSSHPTGSYTACFRFVWCVLIEALKNMFKLCRQRFRSLAISSRFSLLFGVPQLIFQNQRLQMGIREELIRQKEELVIRVEKSSRSPVEDVSQCHLLRCGMSNENLQDVNRSSHSVLFRIRDDSTSR